MIPAEMRRALGVTLVISIVNGICTRQSADSHLWLVLLATYLLLTAFAIATFRRQGVLSTHFMPRGGDVSTGILAGLSLLAAAWLLRHQIVPQGSARMGWLFQIYASIGRVEGDTIKTLGVIALAATEETVWRGLVTDDLKARFGARRTVPIAAGLYALAYLPTAFTLADPGAGPNPLVVLTALGSGLVWTFIAVRTNRLFTVFVAHAVFTYFASVPLYFGGAF